MKIFSIKTDTIIVLILCAIPSMLYAAEKIVVFDIQRIMKDSKVVQSYRGRYNETLEQKRKPLMQKEEEARILKDTLDKGTFNIDERLLKENEFAYKMKELKRLKEDLDFEVLQMDRWLKAQVFKDLDGILKETAKHDGYVIILEKNSTGVAYVDEAVDITEKILSIYNKRSQ